MSTIPDECTRNVRVRVTVGDTVHVVEVSGELLRQKAEEVLVPHPFLHEDNYEARMIRRALMPVMRVAIEQIAWEAAKVEVSRMLRLDPDKGW